jgi:hypothetical protein
MRGECSPAGEAAANGVALPGHVAGTGIVACVIGLLAVLGVGTVGVVLRLTSAGWRIKRRLGVEG